MTSCINVPKAGHTLCHPITSQQLTTNDWCQFAGIPCHWCYFSLLDVWRKSRQRLHREIRFLTLSEFYCRLSLAAGLWQRSSCNVWPLLQNQDNNSAFLLATLPTLAAFAHIDTHTRTHLLCLLMQLSSSNLSFKTLFLNSSERKKKHPTFLTINKLNSLYPVPSVFYLLALVIEFLEARVVIFRWYILPWCMWCQR